MFIEFLFLYKMVMLLFLLKVKTEGSVFWLQDE